MLFGRGTRGLRPWLTSAAPPGLVLTLIMAIALCGSAHSQPPDKKPTPESDQGEGVSLTIYNQNFVVVRERRMLDLPKGRGTVRFRDVATGAMVERSWTLAFDPRAPAFDRATPTMQLTGASALLAEKLRGKARVRLRHARRGPFDVRRTMRASFRTLGVPMTPIRRRKRRDRPKLVVLCDVSDSVRLAARFMLELV